MKALIQTKNLKTNFEFLKFFIIAHFKIFFLKALIVKILNNKAILILIIRALKLARTFSRIKY